MRAGEPHQSDHANVDRLRLECKRAVAVQRVRIQPCECTARALSNLALEPENDEARIE